MAPLTEWLALAGQLTALAGTAVMTLGVVGIVRAPRAGVKIHANSTIAVIGLPLVLAAGLFTGDAGIVTRVLVVGLFAAVTAPLSTHALARLDRSTH